MIHISHQKKEEVLSVLSVLLVINASDINVLDIFSNIYFYYYILNCLKYKFLYIVNILYSI